MTRKVWLTEEELAAESGCTVEQIRNANLYRSEQGLYSTLFLRKWIELQKSNNAQREIINKGISDLVKTDKEILEMRTASTNRG